MTKAVFNNPALRGETTPLRKSSRAVVPRDFYSSTKVVPSFTQQKKQGKDLKKVTPKAPKKPKVTREEAQEFRESTTGEQGEEEEEPVVVTAAVVDASAASPEKEEEVQQDVLMEEEEEDDKSTSSHDTEKIDDDEEEEEENPFGRFATPKAAAAATTTTSSSSTPGLSRLMEGLKTTTVPDFRFPKNTTTTSSTSTTTAREVFTTAPDSKGRVQTYYEVPKAQRIQFTNPKSTAVHAFDIKTPSGRMAPLILFKDEASGIDAVITTMVSSQSAKPTSKENPIVLEEEEEE
jgi:hypothetical protein